MIMLDFILKSTMNFSNPLDRKHLLTIDNPWYKNLVAEFWRIQNVWDESQNDITSDVLKIGDEPVTAVVIAKSAGVCAGIEEVAFLLRKAGLECFTEKADGESIATGEVLMRIDGSAKKLLQYERTLLNMLSRMSGIAGATSHLKAMLPESILVCSTRKTLWGTLDKKAVAIGGGGTHRLHMQDAVLIKENNLALCENGIETALQRIDETQDEFAFWEIEVEDEQEFSSVLENLPQKRPGVIMLDNFSPDAALRLLEDSKIPEGIFIEISGGITADNIADYCFDTVNAISAGFLTNNAPVLDLSMRIER
jgi:nicotinate-nucleotide pyrophosphorylase (carboxylating)